MSFFVAYCSASNKHNTCSLVVVCSKKNEGVTKEITISTNTATNTNSSAVLEIKNVPTGLILYALEQWVPCNDYAKKTGVGNNTNRFLRGISVWLILKNETGSGKIQAYRSQIPDLAAKCKMSPRSFDKYLGWLKGEGLLHIEGKDLLLHDYKVIRKYKIDIRQREKTIYYDTRKEASLPEILISIAIGKLQDRWKQVYWNKLTQNKDEYKRLYDLFVFLGADASRLEDPEYFRECHLEAMLQAYKEEKPGQPVYDYLHKHIKANPDLNAMANTYAKKMGYNAAMSFCHLKFRLKKRGLIEVDKDHIESDCRSRKDEKIYHHRWVAKTQITIWFRCDQITINKHLIYASK